MSAGPFVISRYGASYGAGTAIHPIRIQPETLGLTVTAGTPVANTAPTGAVTNPISARVTSGRRTIGLGARKISFRFSGTPPTGYSPNAVLTVPWLTPFPTSFARGLAGTYLGAAIVVVGLSPEVAR